MDLVERLRDEVTVGSGMVTPLRMEAATEIERLRRELQKHREERSYVIGWNNGFEHALGQN